MTQEHRFLVALLRLRDWHIDSVKAQSFSGTQAGAPGPRVLVAQHYPSLIRWAERWKFAREGQREEIIAELEAEFYALGVSASQRYAEHFGTAAWKRAIGTAEGSTRQVSRLWGVSKSTVSRYRKEFA